MPNLLVVVGLCGAGKTRLAESLVAAGEFEASATDLVEDPGMARLPELVAWFGGDDRRRRLCMDGDSWCCAGRRGRLRRALPGVAVRFRFFAKDVPACLANVLHDGVHRDRRASYSAERLQCLLLHEPAYEVPAGVEAMPVVAHPIDAATVAAFFARFPAVAHLRDPVTARLGLDAGRHRWRPTCPA